MSANERAEIHAFHELETLVRHLGEELAAFRRRALSAEAQLKDLGQDRAGKPRGAGAERLTALEVENDALTTRLGRSEDRVRQMMDRVRFLRQQLQSQAVGSGTTLGGATGS